MNNSTMKKLAIVSAVLILLTGLSAAQTNLTLTKVQTEPAPLKTGQYADVWFKVSNAGSDTAENVTVEFLENYPFSVDPGTQKRWSLRNVGTGDNEEYVMHFQVRVDANAVQGEDELEFRLTREGGSGTYELPVEIRADDTSLVVNNVYFPEKVGPGSTTEMTLTLENMANAYFRNIDVSMDFSQIPVAALGTSTKRVTSIAPNAERNVTFTLAVDESAENGVQKIPVTLSYESEAGSDVQKTFTTGTVIGGSPRIETALNENGDISSGSTGTVTFRFVNRGEGTAKFVKVDFLEAEGYSILSGDSVYLGDMNPDDYQTAEAEIYTEPGTDSIEVPVELTYREDGEEKTATSTVNVNVLTGDELQMYGANSRSYLVPGIVVVLLLAAGVYYWRRKRR